MFLLYFPIKNQEFQGRKKYIPNTLQKNFTVTTPQQNDLLSVSVIRDRCKHPL